MDATSTTVAAGAGTRLQAVTTDKAVGLVVLGSLAYLILLRRAFRGSVI